MESYLYRLPVTACSTQNARRRSFAAESLPTLHVHATDASPRRVCVCLRVRGRAGVVHNSVDLFFRIDYATASVSRERLVKSPKRARRAFCQFSRVCPSFCHTCGRFSHFLPHFLSLVLQFRSDGANPSTGCGGWVSGDYFHMCFLTPFALFMYI